MPLLRSGAIDLVIAMKIIGLKEILLSYLCAKLSFTLLVDMRDIA